MAALLRLPCRGVKIAAASRFAKKEGRPSGGLPFVSQTRIQRAGSKGIGGDAGPRREARLTHHLFEHRRARVIPCAAMHRIQAG